MSKSERSNLAAFRHPSRTKAPPRHPAQAREHPRSPASFKTPHTGFSYKTCSIAGSRFVQWSFTDFSSPQPRLLKLLHLGDDSKKRSQGQPKASLIISIHSMEVKMDQEQMYHTCRDDGCCFSTLLPTSFISKTRHLERCLA